MNYQQFAKVSRSSVKILGLCISTLLTSMVCAQSMEPDKLFAKISPSIWVVATYDGAEKRLGQGSAVVIGPGTLITNCHVLAKAKGFVIKQDNVLFGASLAYADVERDLCQIQVKNFTAPAVEMAATANLRVGQKVYAIGNPRGLEITFSDGMISGLRKGEDDKTVVRVQTTAPISPGSSGGGLFDGQGRLVGITTSMFRDSQNLNFAIPADWLSEVPARAKEALAKRSAGGNRVAATGQPGPRQGNYFPGQQWTYAVVDRTTNLRQAVELRVDRIDGDSIVFNGGRRVENPSGRVVRAQDRLLSELDAVNVIGGWIHGENVAARSWSVDAAMESYRLDLNGVYSGDSKITTPAGQFDVQVFRFSGYRISHPRALASAAYEAVVWFAPSINRIVKFSANSPGANMSGIARIDEEVILERYDK